MSLLQEILKLLEKPDHGQQSSQDLAPTVPHLPPEAQPITPLAWDARARSEINLKPADQDALPGKPVQTPGMVEALVAPVDARPPMPQADMTAFAQGVVNPGNGLTKADSPSSSSSVSMSSSDLTSSPSSPSSSSSSISTTSTNAPQDQPQTGNPVRMTAPGHRPENGPGVGPLATLLDLANRISPLNNGRTR